LPANIRSVSNEGKAIDRHREFIYIHHIQHSGQALNETGYKANEMPSKIGRRFAVISDIHSNLEALTKTFEIIDRQHIEEIVCIGDIVGYGADPNGCIEMVRQRCNVVIKGNHDDAVGNIPLSDNFTEHARSAILWTRQQLSAENSEYLGTLPISHIKDDVLFVHASPCHPEVWKYIFQEDDAEKAFQCFSEPVCFIGHTHIPAIFSPAGRVYKLKSGERYIINIGSVGQPRDRNSQLSFGIFDMDAFKYENIRSQYDVETAVMKILRTDLPPMLGHRLLIGL
jgi:diadenosine tetraphosphatase ApaH/serine/threonine PP2A family protein phosphatase